MKRQTIGIMGGECRCSEDREYLAPLPNVFICGTHFLMESIVSFM